MFAPIDFKSNKKLEIIKLLSFVVSEYLKRKEKLRAPLGISFGTYGMCKRYPPITDGVVDNSFQCWFNNKDNICFFDCLTDCVDGVGTYFPIVLGLNNNEIYIETEININIIRNALVKLTYLLL